MGFVCLAIVTLAMLAVPDLALGGLPTHLPLPDPIEAGFSLDHACGAAVDDEGDIYVSSAGTSKVEVFEASGAHLASIANSDEPCALAVDTKGNLYVSEKAKGEVVKYHPTEYPFSGTPTYEGPTAIDASGNAKGIAVDPVEDRLYVAEGNRVSVYNADGTLGVTEVQRVFPFQATGGTFTLSFEGKTTSPLSYNAEHWEVQAALEGLTTIGAGNVSVTQGPSPEFEDHVITFTGALAPKDVDPIACDGTKLEGSSAFCFAPATNPSAVITNGFNGRVGEGKLGEATGVAAYSYKVSNEGGNGEIAADRYVFVADTSGADRVDIFGGGDIRTLKLRREIAGPKEGENFGFGSAGAYLAVDSGNRSEENKCNETEGRQACTEGHLLVYDDGHAKVDEFDASGEFLDQFTSPELADAEPTAMAVDRSASAGNGNIYVTSGAGPGAKLLAFGPLTPPSRAQLNSGLSHELKNARGVAVDSTGDVYVAAGSEIRIYDPTGVEVTKITDGELPYRLAVDSTGKLYTLEQGPGIKTELVTYYTPSSYPPASGTTYSRHTPAIFERKSLPTESGGLVAIAINPGPASGKDHLFITAQQQTLELGSAAEGSPILNPTFASGISLPSRTGIAVHGADGNVYIAGNTGSFVGGGRITVVNPAGTEALARFNGAGSPGGVHVDSPVIAIDQSNGHVVAFAPEDGFAREFDASGAFVSEFGQFTSGEKDIAIDNSSGPGRGRVYIAIDEAAPGTPDLWAFGPLSYGEPPLAVTGSVGGLGAGSATLNGTVNPHGFELESCHFEYSLESEYQGNLEAEEPAFEGAEEESCVETPLAIGSGSNPVAVHTGITSLDPAQAYRYRLVAKNKYGVSEGDAGLFGPPRITPEAASPVFYTEATLRANIDPSGLATTYHFEYGLEEDEYDHSLAVHVLPASEGGVEVDVPITGLEEATEYHFRVVAENEAMKVEEPDQAFETLRRDAPASCLNSEYRTGLATQLSDCRAYELVTPAETGGLSPSAGEGGADFNNWLATPRDTGAGERLSFYTPGTLPGFDGNGRLDGYLSERTAGVHPTDGWKTQLAGPDYAQSGGILAPFGGVSADQLFSAWAITLPKEAFDGNLPEGLNLLGPRGFEPLGQGSNGTDPKAIPHYLSTGGTHVIFSSKEELEGNAAPKGTEAIYDRGAGSSGAGVLSLKPDGSSFGAGQNATFVGANEDGSAVAFEVGGALYTHRAGETAEVATAPNAFAGISADGRRVFYADQGQNLGPVPAGLFYCEIEGGSCAGSEATQAPTQIAKEAIFANVSPDGSHVFFSSEEALTGAEENENGEAALPHVHNLYAWDGTATRFVAVLDPHDFTGFSGLKDVGIGFWAKAVNEETGGLRADSPTRSTPDGAVLVFQSHAQLTSYDNLGPCGPEGATARCGGIYRYAPAAPAGERLICLSCDPTAAPPVADATLQDGRPISPVRQRSTLIANVTDDGQKVFFHSSDQLKPEDANHAQDVYEWRADGAGQPTCGGSRGCLNLISSGQGERNSYLFGMSADGHDVFFWTEDELVGGDVSGSKSIYDAREGGGIPEASESSGCRGEVCQPAGSPPTLSMPASTGPGGGNEAPPPPPCGKGKHRVKGHCVPRHRRRRHHNHRSRHGRRGH